MIIAISGTPGTGKSKIAKILAKKLNANLLSISKLIEKIPHKYDRKRRTKIIDTKDLQKAVNRNIINGINIIEGHLSHLLKSDVLFILRCNPMKLSKILKARKWPKKKIEENIEAEILGSITIEALENTKLKAIFELDATKGENVAELMLKILKYFNQRKYKQLEKYKPRIDWLERYFYMIK